MSDPVLGARMSDWQSLRSPSTDATLSPRAFVRACKQAYPQHSQLNHVTKALEELSASDTFSDTRAGLELTPHHRRLPASMQRGPRQAIRLFADIDMANRL